MNLRKVLKKDKRNLTTEELKREYEFIREWQRNGQWKKTVEIMILSIILVGMFCIILKYNTSIEPIILLTISAIYTLLSICILITLKWRLNNVLQSVILCYVHKKLAEGENAAREIQDQALIGALWKQAGKEEPVPCNKVYILKDERIMYLYYEDMATHNMKRVTINSGYKEEISVFLETLQKMFL